MFYAFIVYSVITMICAQGEALMLKTILIGSYQSIQGTLVQTLANGRVVVRVGNKLFEGVPVARKSSAA